jgi:hypothetical protein
MNQKLNPEQTPTSQAPQEPHFPSEFFCARGDYPISWPVASTDACCSSVRLRPGAFFIHATAMFFLDWRLTCRQITPTIETWNESVIMRTESNPKPSTTPQGRHTPRSMWCSFCVPGAPHLDASDWVYRESQRKSDGTHFQTSLLCSKANREQPRAAVLLNRTPLASAHSNYLEDWTARGVHVFFVGARFPWDLWMGSTANT